MQKFIALYMIPVASMDEMMKNSTPEQRQAGMDSWKQWAKMHEKDLVDLGVPLGKNKRVTASGVSDVRNEVCGYSLVQAESHDAAAKLFMDNPHLQMSGAYVEVLECRSMQ